MVMQVLITGFASALLMGSGSVAIHRSRLSRQLQDCRTTVFQVQTDLAQTLSVLMKLNPTALRLESESRRLKAQLAANPDPATKAALAARLSVIVSEQLALKTRQLMILSEGRLRANSQIGQWQVRQQGQTNPVWVNLAVIPQMMSIAPPYKAHPDFENQQRLVLQVQREGQTWVKCGATLAERDQGWEVRLNVGRSL